MNIIDNILQYYSIFYTFEEYLTIPNNISSLLSGMTSIATLKLFCDPDRQIPRRASYRGAFAPKNDLNAMKRIWTRIQAENGAPTQKLKKISVS